MTKCIRSWFPMFTSSDKVREVFALGQQGELKSKHLVSKVIKQVQSPQILFCPCSHGSKAITSIFKSKYELVYTVFRRRFVTSETRLYFLSSHFCPGGIHLLSLHTYGSMFLYPRAALPPLYNYGSRNKTTFSRKQDVCPLVPHQDYDLPYFTTTTTGSTTRCPRDLCPNERKTFIIILTLACDMFTDALWHLFKIKIVYL